MKIFITGGAGYIGGTVTRVLLATGHQVTVFDNFCHSRRTAVAAGATLIEGSLADRPLLESALAIRSLRRRHALRRAHRSRRIHEVAPSSTFATTPRVPSRCLRPCSPPVMTSSSSPRPPPAMASPSRHRSLSRPASPPPTPYGESKLLSEHMMRWISSAHGLRFAALRYFNVAGAITGYGEHHEPESHLIPLILDVALGRRPGIKIFGQDYPTPDGTCVRDYIHVQDLADAHLLALQALCDPARPSQMIYNIGNGHGFTVQQVVDSVRRVTGHRIPVELQPRRPGDPAVLVAGSAAIQRDLGWSPKHPELDQIVASAWTWHQQLFPAVPS